MAQARGIDIAVNLYEEAAYAVEAGLTIGIKAYPTKFKLVPKQNLIDSATLNARRSRSEPQKGNVDVAGTIETELSSEWTGVLFNHLFGTVVRGSGPPYTHTYTIGNLPVGLTIEKYNGSNIVGSGSYERFNGCKVSKAKFKFPTEGFVSADYDFIGARFVNPLPSSPLDATPDDYGHTPFSSFEISSILEGGSSIATVQDVEIDLDNGLDKSLYTIGNSGFRRALPEGFATISGSLQALFEDAALLAKAIAGTETTLKVVCSRGTGAGSAGNEYCEFNITHMKYELAGIPVDGPKGMLTKLDFKGFYKSGDSGFQVVLKNAATTGGGS